MEEETEKALAAVIGVGETFDPQTYIRILESARDAIHRAHERMKETFGFRPDSPPPGRIPGTQDAYGCWSRLSDVSQYFMCLMVLVRERQKLSPGHVVITSQLDVDGFYMAAQHLVEAYSYVRGSIAPGLAESLPS